MLPSFVQVRHSFLSKMALKIFANFLLLSDHELREEVQRHCLRVTSSDSVDFTVSTTEYPPIANLRRTNAGERGEREKGIVIGELPSVTWEYLVGEEVEQSSAICLDCNRMPLCRAARTRLLPVSIPDRCPLL